MGIEFSERFHRVYKKLVSAFVSYDDTVKADAEFEELTRSRLERDDARKVMGIVRADDELGFKERISPYYIDPSIGVGSAGRAGKISAVITGLVLVLGLALVSLEILDIIDLTNQPQTEDFR